MKQYCPVCFRIYHSSPEGTECYCNLKIALRPCPDEIVADVRQMRQLFNKIAKVVRVTPDEHSANIAITEPAGEPKQTEPEELEWPGDPNEDEYLWLVEKREDIEGEVGWLYEGVFAIEDVADQFIAQFEDSDNYKKTQILPYTCLDDGGFPGHDPEDTPLEERVARLETTVDMMYEWQNEHQEDHGDGWLANPPGREEDPSPPPVAEVTQFSELTGLMIENCAPNRSHPNTFDGNLEHERILLRTTDGRVCEIYRGEKWTLDAFIEKVGLNDYRQWCKTWKSGGEIVNLAPHLKNPDSIHPACLTGPYPYSNPSGCKEHAVVMPGCSVCGPWIDKTLKKEAGDVVMPTGRKCPKCGRDMADPLCTHTARDELESGGSWKQVNAHKCPYCGELFEDRDDAIEHAKNPCKALAS